MTGHTAYGSANPLSIGITALSLLVGGIGYWSVHTKIAGAIIASGQIEVENNRQVVQHAEGGVVEKILVRDGDRVSAGDLLIRLDDTLLRSERAVIELQLVELVARRARLEAERDGASDINPPKTVLSFVDPAATDQIEGQRTFFEARRDTFKREARQVEERVRQSQARIAGTQAQIAALRTQAELVDMELADGEALLVDGLVATGKVNTLRREAARLDGDIGELMARVAEIRGQIAGDRLEWLRRINKRREDVISELRDIQFRELELTEKLRVLTERMERLDIRAQVGGVVFGSSVFAEKAVIQPAEDLMYIVPQDRSLVVSAQVEAIHIDQVHVGQSATLRLTAFNQRVTPEVAGEVVRVSADVFNDDFRGRPYYKIAVAPRQSALSELQDHTLLPGMPVETFLKTEDRTPLSYLTKPLTDYFGRALRGP